MKSTLKRPIHKIEIQRVFRSPGQPHSNQIKNWVNAVLNELDGAYACVVRIVNTEESAELNQNYRHKQGPTNVLSFPFDLPEGFDGFDNSDMNLLGDLVVCAPVIEKEALEQNKTVMDHWAHIIIHGVLHLLGYDHIDEKEAEHMECKEIGILEKLNITNPYIEVID